MLFYLKQRYLKNLKYQDILEVLKHSKNYIFGDIATKAIAFISLPVLTRLLDTADYGTYQVFQSYVAIFVVILTLNFHGSIARYYYDDPDDFGEFISTSLIGSFFFLAIALCVVLLFPHWVAESLGISETLLLLLFPVIAVGVVYAVFKHICVSHKESARYSLINVTRVYLGFGLGVGLIFVFSQQKYMGLILAQLLIGVVVGVYVVNWIRREIKWGPNWHHVRYILSYSIPLVPYTLSNVILGQFDRVMINKSLGASDAGLYSLAYNVGLLVSVTTGSLQAALTPDWFRFMKDGEYKRVDAIIDKVFSLTLFIALGTILFSQEIIMFLTDQRYHTALPVIPIVIIGYVFDAMFKVYGRSIGFTNKMIYVTLVGVLAGGVNVILNLIYIPRYGYVAAAYTTLVSFAVMFILAWWIAKYVLKQHVTPLWILGKSLLIFYGALFLYYALLTLELSLFFSVVLKLGVLLIFSVLIFANQIKRGFGYGT